MKFVFLIVTDTVNEDEGGITFSAHHNEGYEPDAKGKEWINFVPVCVSLNRFESTATLTACSKDRN